jgi:hypothetical protein
VWCAGVQVRAFEQAELLTAAPETGGVAFADVIAPHLSLLLARVNVAATTRAGDLIPADAQALVLGVETTINRMIGWMNDLEGVVVKSGWRNVTDWGSLEADPGAVFPVTQQLCLRLGGHGLFHFVDPATARYNTVAKEHLRLQFEELVKTIRALSQEDDQPLAGPTVGITAHYTLAPMGDVDAGFGT